LRGPIAISGRTLAHSYGRNGGRGLAGFRPHSISGQHDRHKLDPGSMSASVNIGNREPRKPLGPPGEHSRRRSRCVFRFPQVGRWKGVRRLTILQKAKESAAGRHYGGCRVGGRAKRVRASEARSRRGRSPQEAAVMFAPKLPTGGPLKVRVYRYI
jgi:hypothetical protein